MATMQGDLFAGIYMMKVIVMNTFSWNKKWVYGSGKAWKTDWMFFSYFVATGTLFQHVNPLTPTVAIWVQHPVPDRVKLSFVIFDIRALWRSALSVRVPGCQTLQMTV